MQNAVFISGAGKRIGEFLVRQFLAHSDYPVIFSYRSLRPQVEELMELGAVGIQADFTKPHDLTRLVEEIEQQVGSLRALIHNASLWMDDHQAPPGSVGYQQMFAVHVEAPHFLNTALAPLLLQSDSELKDIISLSDYSVDRVKADHIGYLASKAALRTLSQGYAKKFAPQIKVNDIAPSLIIFHADDSDEYKQKRLAQAALPIEPGAKVIWQAVQYLMDNCYTTGTSLRLDGGRFIM